MATENLSPEGASLAASTDNPAIVNATVDTLDSSNPEPGVKQEPQPSYVKLAMRNMVRKRGKSLQHFFLTTVALLGVFIGLSYLTR